uniref:Uncharacterized protein n=1 Tax=Rhizophora mucronata TaxID=61149 RepID=A0A2P2QU54_RHIMU
MPLPTFFRIVFHDQ